MDGTTVVTTLLTVVTGVAIALVVDRYREWRTEQREERERQRTELRESKERQRATLDELQDALNRVNGQVVLHLELPTTALHSTPFAQFLSSVSQDFARIDSLATRVESEPLRASVTALEERYGAVVRAYGTDESKAAADRFGAAAATTNQEIGKLLS